MNSLLMEMVKRTVEKPKQAQSEKEAQDQYANEFKTYEWHYVYEKDNRFYYFVSRPGPSLYEKRVGIAGVFESPNRLQISGFKEVFRTFNMKPEVLLQKGSQLFEKMVNGEYLEGYEPNKRGEEEWIELPDASHQYDSTSQCWVMKK